MATNSLQSLNHHHHSLSRRFSIDNNINTTPTPPPHTQLSSSVFLKPTTTTLSLSTTTTTNLSLSTTTTTNLSLSSTNTTTTNTASTSQTITFDLLEQHLSAKNFRQADEETRRLLIALAGESAVKRGYVFFSEVKFISESDLIAIDELWKKYSDNRFGYSVQKKIWEKANRDFTKLFMKLGWMKKLSSEVEQYNYRAFPNEFTWEINEEEKDAPPVGHLPLTNALRGTQLFNCILTHPAFDKPDIDEEDNKEDDNNNNNGGILQNKRSPLSSSTGFKTDYSF